MGQKWEGIIIHHTACVDTVGFQGNSIEDAHLALHWRDIGYHLLFEMIGTRPWAVLGRPLTERGAHAGPAYNGTHIGIAFVGNFSAAPPPAELLEFSIPYIRWFLDTLSLWDLNAVGIPPLILAHRDVQATECPGRYFDIEKFKEMFQ